MPWPPIIPPNTRQNVTPELDNHPSDHNLISNALTDIAARLGAGGNSELAYAEVTTTQTGITTVAADLTGLTITFTLATRRRVQLIASVWFTKAAPDTASVAYLNLATGANVQQQGGGGWCNAPGQTRVHLTRTLTLAPGTYTYKLRSNTGGGFLNTNSNTAEPSLIQAIDLGPQ